MLYKPIYIVGIGSALLLISVFWFQHIGGLAPCEMCIWQRWPHAIVVCLAILSYFFFPKAQRAVLICMGISLIIGAGIGLLHTGVEQQWWNGFTTCSGSLSDASKSISTDLLFEEIMNAPLVRCDQVSWTFMHLSMASWNAVISVCMSFYCFTKIVYTKTRISR